MTFIQSLADKPSVYILWHYSCATPMVAVNCQVKADAPFPDAANIMQSLTGLTGHQDWSSESWDQEKAQKSNVEQVKDLGRALALHDDNYELWNFDVCAVKEGRFQGVKFVAIGSNVDKRKRAGSLALALTASYIELTASVAWSKTFSNLAESVRHAMAQGPPRFPARDSGYLSQQGMPEDLVPDEPRQEGPVPEELTPLMAYLSEADPPCSEQVTSSVPPPWCQQVQPSTIPWCQDMEDHKDFSAEAHVAQRPGSADSHDSRARLREASVDSDSSEVVLYNPTPVSEQAAPPRGAPIGDSEVVLSNATGSEKTPPSETESFPESSPWAHFQGSFQMTDIEFQRLRQGLGRHSDDALTIATLGTEDTIPMGTDLDPLNSYNNAWAASKIEDENGKILLTHDLSWRILDAENLGFTFGKRVLKKENHYSVEGVKRAVAYCLRDGCNVIVVGQREALHRDLAAEVQGGRCQVLVADNTDDVIILKKAFEKRCPVVSRDLFRKQLGDLRIDKELQQWYKHAGSKLQVNYTFDEDGIFLPNHALPMPVLRPSRRRVREV
mmetsp:Transcript_91851/g.163489  ORF Transcript_91851/g.163489 Transcript_91851/m.163489 type:complete len:555 (-) Transcript_91851:275-1939(-)